MRTIEFEIIGAAFKCKADEDVFYHRLAEISGIQKIIMEGTRLFVSVCSEREDVVIEEVNAICDMWHVSFRMHYN